MLYHETPFCEVSTWCWLRLIADMQDYILCVVVLVVIVVEVVVVVFCIPRNNAATRCNPERIRPIVLQVTFDFHLSLSY
jgi:hypothetical protein